MRISPNSWLVKKLQRDGHTFKQAQRIAKRFWIGDREFKYQQERARAYTNWTKAVGR